MLIYFFFLFLILVAEFSKVRSDLLFYFIIVCVGLFLCFGYMSGSDWRYYELMYNGLQEHNLQDINYEPGYYIYMLPFVFLGIGFWPFFIFTKIILYGVNCYFLKKYSPNHFYFAFAIYYSFFAIFEFIDNPMRNLIAATLYMYSFGFILDKKFIKYLLVCLIAFLFHQSAILLIPLYFILDKSFKAWSIAIVFIIYNIAIFIYGEQLAGFFRTLDLLSYVQTDRAMQQVSGYLLSDNLKDNPYSLGMIARYLVFVILIIFKKEIVLSSRYGNIIFNSAVLLIFLTRITLIWPIVGRFVMPFSIFYCVALATVIYHSKGNAKLMYYAMLIFIYSGVVYAQITDIYKYIPYTSYLTYIGTEKPSYDYRSDYNFINSPYVNSSSR